MQGGLESPIPKASLGDKNSPKTKDLEERRIENLFFLKCLLISHFNLLKACTFPLKGITANSALELENFLLGSFGRPL
jgi:hypothetical protein